MDGVKSVNRQIKNTNNFKSFANKKQHINLATNKNSTNSPAPELIKELRTNHTISIDNDLESHVVNTTITRKQAFSSRNSLRLAQSNQNTTSQTKSTGSKMLNQMPEDDCEAFRNFLGIETSENYVALSSSCFTKQIGSFQYCLLCGRRERLKDDFSVDNHLESQTHVNNLLRLRSLLINQRPQDESLTMCALEHLLTSWYIDNSLTEANIHDRWIVIEELKNLIAEIDPECSCRVFGSQLDGTSLKNTHINLELIHPNSRLFDSDPKAKNSIHHKLVDPNADYGKQFNHHVMHYDLIPNASDTLYKTAINISKGYSSFNTFTVQSAQDLNCKVPRLVLRHIPTGLNLDICCNASTHFRISNLLRMYLSLDHRALVLGTLVKYWTNICSISNPEQGGTLPPDAYQVLVIYFLQRTEPPVLPCLHELVAAAANRADGFHSSDDDYLLRKLKILSVSEDSSEKKTNGFANKTSRSANQNNEQLEEDVEDEEIDEDAHYVDIEQEFVDSLNWRTENAAPIHRLFIDFLEYVGKDLNARGTVISIRTLKTIQLDQKRWNTEIKAIEHPIKPKINMSRFIGSQRSFEYIKSAFRHAWFYLTSMPLNKQLRKLTEPLADPSDFVEIYVNLNRLDFYFNMREQSMKSSKPVTKYDAPTEMVRQNLFSRDVEVINNLIFYTVGEGYSLETLPKIVARMYNEQLLVPYDRSASVFCWLCRRFNHTKDSCPKGRAKRPEAEISSYNPNFDLEVNLDHGFREMYDSETITTELAQQHQQVIRELTRIINVEKGLSCELQLFGSTVNGLGSSDSDLDICMTIEGNLTGAGVDCVSILRDVQEALESHHAVREMEAILSARVPILKFLYREYKIDLSMYNQCAIHNSQLLKAYVRIDQRVAQLVHIVKRYAKACGIADASRGSLSSYAWSLLVIHFLQQLTPPILPVLQETDRHTSKQSFGVNGWDVWFRTDCDSIEMQPNDLNLTQLFKYFLLFYGNYAFETRVISIRTSRTISKFQKNWNNCMVAIEDPFELTYNLSSRLDDQMAIYIINSFVYTYRHIVKFQEHCLDQGKYKPSTKAIRNLFYGPTIMGSEPPSRGCRLCHKIGHKIKDCPEIKKSRNRRERAPNYVRTGRTRV